MNTFKSNLLLQLICSMFIFLFVYTALSKFIGFTAFKSVLSHSPLIKDKNEILAWGLPISELVASSLLFFPKTKLAGLYLSFALMIVFTIYIAYMVIFTPDLPCSCGGVLKQMTWRQHLVFNLFFTALASIGIWLARKKGIKQLLVSTATN